MSHRVANSLQIIASILLMKARNVQSDETRQHLEDAHRRVMSVASVQQHLQASGKGERVEVGSYLSKLCATLAASMIGDNRRITVNVVAGDGTTTSSQAVSLGLIVTELLVNAVKYAFPDEAAEGHVIVGYEAHGSDWKLSVSDNGAGMPPQSPNDIVSGLGTSLIKALAQQLHAQVDIATAPRKGTTVSVTHATFESRLPTVAYTGAMALLVRNFPGARLSRLNRRPSQRRLFQLPEVEGWGIGNLLLCQVSGEFCFRANFDFIDRNCHELIAHAEKTADREHHCDQG
jgi:chemotaxis protein methyltransferase CheR